jgi:hypothetical protein
MRIFGCPETQLAGILVSHRFYGPFPYSSIQIWVKEIHCVRGKRRKDREQGAQEESGEIAQCEPVHSEHCLEKT